jgi:Flp pilus assembly protein TadG
MRVKGWGFDRRARARDRGANLVEFAIVMPFLLLLLLGIIEFGYFLAEFNDVRHGAREGARSAAVNAGDTTFLVGVTCDAMDLTTGVVTVDFTGGGGGIGDTGSVSVTAAPTSLSGLSFIEALLPNTLTSNVEFRLEQPASWADGGNSC